MHRLYADVEMTLHDGGDESMRLCIKMTTMVTITMQSLNLSP